MKVKELIQKLNKYDKEKEIIIEKLQKENELAKKQVEYDKTHIFTPQTIKLNYIPIQKVKDKISERQFELQQEYKDFEDDAILIVLQELLEGRK